MRFFRTDTGRLMSVEGTDAEQPEDAKPISEAEYEKAIAGYEAAAVKRREAAFARRELARREELRDIIKELQA